MSNYDTVVVGSGGAGLVAAITASDAGHSVAVLEASDQVGGTTALSGGQMWLPNTDVMSRHGHNDSPDDALTYLKRTTLTATDEEHLKSFIENAPKFACFLENEVGFKLFTVDRPDYHPNWDGAAQGRTHEPAPVDTESLGTWRSRVRVSSTRPPLTSVESRTGLDEEALEERKRNDVRTQGAGLVAGLVGAALKRDVSIHTDSRVNGLRRAGDRWELRTDSGETFFARHVVLAAGGFARNTDMRNDFLPGIALFPTAAPGSLGEGIVLGAEAGGRLHGMSEAWWTAASPEPVDPEAATATYRNVVRELAFPGSILVNGAGERFVNEASSYNDLGKSFIVFDATEHAFPNENAWLVFDDNFRSTRTVLGVSPTAPTPSWMAAAATLEDLADQIGVDSEGLQRTVEEFNGFARTGEDARFGRGQNTHDQFNGDIWHTPNACLGELRDAPFYAAPIGLGVNGTKGGLLTDATARVLDNHGNVIDGLYALGENAAALMGPGYAGSGASLGPSLTTAYVFGTHI